MHSHFNGNGTRITQFCQAAATLFPSTPQGMLDCSRGLVSGTKPPQGPYKSLRAYLAWMAFK